MKILFYCDPGDSRAVDEAYERREAKAAAALGIEYHLFDYEALVNEGDPAMAVRRVTVELGDGQVAGLPDNADVRSFYSALRNASGLPAHEGWDGAAGRSYSG